VVLDRQLLKVKLIFEKILTSKEFQMFTLSEYIERKTVAQVSRDLGVDSSTVSQWKALIASPRPHTAYKLIQQTNNLLTWESIYLPYVERDLKSQLELDFTAKK